MQISMTILYPVEFVLVTPRNLQKSVRAALVVDGVSSGELLIVNKNSARVQGMLLCRTSAFFSNPKELSL